jgi:hypothetical protein
MMLGQPTFSLQKRMTIPVARCTFDVAEFVAMTV